MQSVDTITAAISGLENTLDQERMALLKLRHELLQQSVELALEHGGDYAAILNQTLEIREAIAHAEQAINELPEIIDELQAQLEAAQTEAQAQAMQADRQRNDELFHAELQRIIEAGSATPAELLQLRRYAAASSNPARRYDIDRLTEALEDHNRRVKSARSRHQEPPVFIFDLEENGGK